MCGKSLIKLNSLKLITFDATGTLLQFRKPPFQIYADIGRKYGLEVDGQSLQKSFKHQWKILNASEPHFGHDGQWKEWWTKFVIGTFKDSMLDKIKDPKILSFVASDLIEHFKTDECWELKPGAKEFLNNLRSIKQSSQNGFGFGVISNFDPRLREILQLFGIQNYFNFLLLSHEVQISKPNPLIFNLANQLHFKSDNSTKNGEFCLHIGDNYELDYLGAKNAGWKAALILPDAATNEINRNAIVFSSLKEFNDLVFS